jgi:hypothetical protein
VTQRPPAGGRRSGSVGGGAPWRAVPPVDQVTSPMPREPLS